MKGLWFMARRQLWHRRGLNGIAVAGVVFGVLTLISITGIMRGFQTKFLNTILDLSPHVVVFDTELGETFPLVHGGDRNQDAVRVRRQTTNERRQRIERPRETVQALEQLPGVAAVAALVVGNAVASAGNKEMPVELRGIDVESQDKVTPLRALVVEGSAEAFAGTTDGALVGRQLALTLGIGLGDRFACASAQGERILLQVSGIFESGIAALDKSRVYVPVRIAQTALGRGDAIDRLELKLTDPETAENVARHIEALLAHDAESWQATNASMLGVFYQQNLITGFIVGAVLLVGGFAILAIQIMIVLDKRRDIALLKSVGYSSREILTLFLGEGVVVSFLGASVGAGLSHLVLAGMRTIKSASGMGYTKASNFAIYETPAVYVMAFGFAVGVGILASLLPAWRASRVQPVDVLRGS